MKITEKKYAQLLFEMTQDKNSDEIELAIKKFIELLAKKNQIKNSKKIIQNFIKIWNIQNDTLETEIVTAKPINEDIKIQIEDFIKRKTKAKKIESKNTINKNLISGVIIKYGDRILDNSLKNRINNLKINMIK